MRSISDWLEGDLQVNGRRLHYYRSEGNRPALVLVHGFTDNALYWTRTAEALAPEWDVVMYDARGHGQSERARGAFNDAERVADLVGVIETLGLTRPALIGHSMGAATIALAAAQYPELSRGLVLEDPAWFEPPPDETEAEAAERQAMKRDRRAEWRDWVQSLQTGTWESGLGKIQANSPAWSPVDQALSLNARRQVELDLFSFYPQERAIWRSLLPQIRCPILLLLGDNRDRHAIITMEQAEEAARLWQQGQWVQIGNAGHSIRYDQFEQYLAVVHRFLRGLLPESTV